MILCACGYLAVLVSTLTLGRYDAGQARALWAAVDYQRREKTWQAFEAAISDWASSQPPR